MLCSHVSSSCHEVSSRKAWEDKTIYTKNNVCNYRSCPNRRRGKNRVSVVPSVQLCVHPAKHTVTDKV